MPPRRATRDQAPPLDDTPTREELIEALANLRTESDAAYALIQRAQSREAVDRAKQRWTNLHRHMDEMVAGVLTLDALESRQKMVELDQ